MENSPGQRPWFERLMAARNDPVWVMFAVFFVPAAWFILAMGFIAIKALIRT